MASKLIPLLVPPGQTESVDDRILEIGRAKSVRNARARRVGRVGKKYGNSAVSTTVATGSTGVLGTGLPNAITQLGDSEVFVSSGTVFKNTSQGWYNAGRVSRFLPAGRDVVESTEASVEGVRFAGVARSSTAALNLFVCSYTDATLATDVTLWQLQDDNGAVVRRGAINNGFAPRVVSAGSSFYIVYANGTTDLRVTTITASSVADASLATIASGFKNHEVAPFSSTQFLVIYQTTTTNVRISLVTAPTTIAASQNATVSATAQRLAVMGTSGENIYAAWSTQPAGVETLRAQAFNAALSASTGGPTDVVTAITFGSDFGFVRYNVSTALLVYGTDIGTDTWRLTWGTFTNAGVYTAFGTCDNALPASLPFTVNSRFYIFAHKDLADSSTTLNTWGAQRHYVLLDITDSNVAGGVPFIEATTLPLQGSRFVDDELGAVVSDDNHIIWATLRLVRQTTTGSGLSDMNVLEAIRFYPPSTSVEKLYGAHRQSARAGEALYFTGGVVTGLTGRAVENGFAHYPSISSLTFAAGGVLSAGAYQYAAVYEWIDPHSGERHRSAPSLLVSGTAAANDKCTITITGITETSRSNPYAAFTQGPEARIHLYRTVANGSTFYRITPTVTRISPNAISSPAVTLPLTFIDDGVSDAVLINNEILYTNGGVVDNMPAPAARCIAAGGNRLWLGGLLERNKVVCSKLLVPGEPAQFTDHEAFSIFFPEPIEGIAWLDGALFALSENSIYVVYGDGPNDQGQGAFTDPRALPSEEGCIDYRSVIATSKGIFYQGERGLWLIPRGGGAPSFVGADVLETLSRYSEIVATANVVEPGAWSANDSVSESTTRFVCYDVNGDDSVVLVFDHQTNAWTVDTWGTSLGCGGVWNGKFTVCRDSASFINPIRQEDPTVWGNLTSFVETRIQFGDIRPFGLCGWGRFRKLIVMGESRTPDGSTFLSIDYKFDNESATQTKSELIEEATGALFYREFTLASSTNQNQHGSALTLSVYDVNPGASEGLVLHGIFLEVDGEPGVIRLPGGSRV